MKLFGESLDMVLKDDISNPRKVENKIYDDLDWMPYTSDSPIAYDEHEERMVSGWRAPTCQEYFNLLYAYEEGLVDKHTNDVVTDMIGNTEIANCAVILKGGFLEVYQMIEGLRYNSNFSSYSVSYENWYKTMHSFNISDLEVNRAIPLEEINQKFPEMLDLFYGRVFYELPDIAKSATIFISTLEDSILIAGTGDDRSRYNLNLSRFNSLSRGVASK